MRKFFFSLKRNFVLFKIIILEVKHILRGLHYQINHPQDKLVRVSSGKVFDVIVDLRRSSSTFGKSFGIELSAENKKKFFVPKGFAHGFIVLSEYADFQYKTSDYYYPEYERVLLWNCKKLDIKWPCRPNS